MAFVLYVGLMWFPGRVCFYVGPMWFPGKVCFIRGPGVVSGQRFFNLARCVTYLYVVIPSDVVFYTAACYCSFTFCFFWVAAEGLGQQGEVVQGGQ